MTTNLYVTLETPYNPAVAGLTVEAWEDSLFSHSPVGNPSAYPPASSPTATTTTDSSGNCELTGLTAGTNYYVSHHRREQQAMVRVLSRAYLGNLSTTRRQFSINPGACACSADHRLHALYPRALIGSHAITTATLVPWDTETAENGTTLVLNLSTNAMDAPADAYYNVNAHIDFQAGAAKFVAGDLLTVSLYCDATFLSSTTVAPPTGATKFSVEVTDTYIGGAYTVQATRTTAGTTVTALAGSHMTVQAIPNVVLGSRQSLL